MRKRVRHRHAPPPPPSLVPYYARVVREGEGGRGTQGHIMRGVYTWGGGGLRKRVGTGGCLCSHERTHSALTHRIMNSCTYTYMPPPLSLPLKHTHTHTAHFLTPPPPTHTRTYTNHKPCPPPPPSHTHSPPPPLTHTTRPPPPIHTVCMTETHT